MRLERDDGAAAVEFALVAPILILLIFGIIAFGMGFYTQQGAAAAAREAARRAAVGSITSCSGTSAYSDLRYIVQQTAPGSWGTGIGWDSTHMPTMSTPAADTVQVQVPYRFDLLGLGGLVPLPTIDLTATAQAHIEQPLPVSSC